MKLFNLMDNELQFLKQGLALNAPLLREFGMAGTGCDLCRDSCTADCSGKCTSFNVG